MQSEILNRGPIACSIGATPLFEFNYTNGIYSELSDLPVCSPRARIILWYLNFISSQIILFPFLVGILMSKLALRYAILSL